MFVISSRYFRSVYFSSSSKKASIADYCTMRLETGRPNYQSYLVLVDIADNGVDRMGNIHGPIFYFFLAPTAFPFSHLVNLMLTTSRLAASTFKSGFKHLRTTAAATLEY